MICGDCDYYMRGKNSCSLDVINGYPDRRRGLTDSCGCYSKIGNIKKCCFSCVNYTWEEDNCLKFRFIDKCKPDSKIFSCLLYKENTDKGVKIGVLDTHLKELEGIIYKNFQNYAVNSKIYEILCLMRDKLNG